MGLSIEALFGIKQYQSSSHKDEEGLPVIITKEINKQGEIISDTYLIQNADLKELSTKKQEKLSRGFKLISGGFGLLLLSAYNSTREDTLHIENGFIPVALVLIRQGIVTINGRAIEDSALNLINKS